MMDEKPIGMDNSGAEALKEAVIAMLNEYPDLDGRTVGFSSLTEDGGISMEPDSGALIYKEKKDIIGGVHQECRFPFFVVYRANVSSEFLKMKINEFLDKMGAWLCKEPVTIDGEEHQMSAYPAITGGRKITGVTRFNSYALEPNANKTQDWVIPITVNYTHEFAVW